ncbi:MAG: hypothetical protein ABIJ61_10035 [bacterium]
MTSFYRIGSKWMIALLVIVMLVAVGCSSDDKDNGNNDTNSAPQNVAISLTQTALTNAGGTVGVTVSASDPDGDALTYTYSVTLGSISGSGSAVNWIVPQNTGSSTLQGSITVTVSDGSLSAQAQAGITVAGVAQTERTRIYGTLSLQAGVNGNLDNTQVAIYGTLGDWNTYAPALYTAATGVGAGSSATYNLEPVASGLWYLDAWKDIDANGIWSAGDLVGWVGAGGLNSPTLSAFSLAQNQELQININNMVPF